MHALVCDVRKSFMYQDIYRSLDKFSAAVGKSSVCLKIKETVGELKKKKQLNEGVNSFQVYFTLESDN